MHYCALRVKWSYLGNVSFTVGRVSCHPLNNNESSQWYKWLYQSNRCIITPKSSKCLFLSFFLSPNCFFFFFFSFFSFIFFFSFFSFLYIFFFSSSSTSSSPSFSSFSSSCFSSSPSSSTSSSLSSSSSSSSSTYLYYYLFLFFIFISLNLLLLKSSSSSSSSSISLPSSLYNNFYSDTQIKESERERGTTWKEYDTTISLTKVFCSLENNIPIVRPVPTPLYYHALDPRYALDIVKQILLILTVMKILHEAEIVMVISHSPEYNVF